MRIDHHIALLGKPRTLALRQLVFESVKPGMRVLDAGTGSGVLATWAALAGAGEVVTVDREHAGLAIDLARANGMHDRITHVKADLSSWRPEGQFDVIFGMLYENDPRRDDWVVGIFSELLADCLAPGGVAIPGRVQYRARLEDRPDLDYSTACAHVERTVGRLSATLNLTLAPLADWSLRGPLMGLFPQRQWDGTLAGAGKVLSTEPAVYRADYPAPGAHWPEHIEMSVVAEGTATCVAWTQELAAADGRLIFVNESVSWLPAGCRVTPGQRLRLALGERWMATNVATPVEG